MVRFLISLIVALWVSAIALIAIQNATPVSLQFLGIKSIEIPLGLIMAFSAALGLTGTALALEIGLSSRS